METNRIQLRSTMQDAVAKMADGNPGALTVMLDVAKAKGPDAFITLCHLDDMKIYGSDIWLCYKDICKQDINRLIAEIQKRTWLQAELRKIR